MPSCRNFSGNDAKMFQTHIFDGDLTLGHCGQPDKRPDLDHIGQHPVFGSAQVFNAFDLEQVASDALDLGAHAVQHFAELLDIGLAGGIVNGGGAFGHYGGHYDIGCAGNGGLVQQHVCTFQVEVLRGGKNCPACRIQIVHPVFQNR